MSYATLSINLRGDETFGDGETPGGGIYLRIDDAAPGGYLTIWLPDSDEDAELTIGLLRAALDNAESRVRVRRQKRQADVHPSEEVVGWQGAGASVEAQRG